MKPSYRHAFTLIELLVVIAVIGVLAGIVLPIYGNVQLTAKRVQSLSNMRQLGMATINFCTDNNNTLPATFQGDTTAPTWANASKNTTSENAAWYNVLPRTYAGSKGVGDFLSNPAAFYTSNNLLYVPAGKYPSKAVCIANPQFAVAFNSKLLTGTVTSVPIQRVTLPSETVLFQECGLAGETPIKGQKAYTNQSYSYASRTAARYNGQTILTFFDGHAAVFSGSSIVDPSTGKAYFTAYPGAFPSGAAKVYWEVDPTASPNS